jgi:hypothetical protein
MVSSKKRKRLVIVCCPILLAGLALFAAGCEKGEKGDDPATISVLAEEGEKTALPDCPENAVALVDDRVITFDDAEKRTKITLRLEGVDETDLEYKRKLKAARKGAVEFLIEAYVLQEAATDAIEVSSEEFEHELLLHKMRHPSREAYEKWLEREELTEKGFEDLIRRELQIRKALAIEAARGVVKPTAEEARVFFDKNALLFEWPFRVRYDQIVWPLLGDIPDTRVEEAQHGMQKLSDEIGGNVLVFDKVLEEATQTVWGYVGQRLPYQNVDKLPETVQEALQLLDTNEPSAPIRTPQGIVILCIRSTRQTYASAENEILNALYEAKLMDRLEAWKEAERKKHKVRICNLDYYEGTGEWDVTAEKKE